MTEAEYIALSQAMRKIIPMMKHLEKLEKTLNIESKRPNVKCKVFKDNKGGALANSIAPLLSLNTIYLTLGRFYSMSNVFSNCSRCSIIGMIYLISCDSEMYYASAVDKDILDCNLDAHSIRQFYT